MIGNCAARVLNEAEGRATIERLRDEFAGLALVGMTASPELMNVVTSGSVMDGSAFERMSKKAYELADAMLKARNGSEATAP